jgi:hypothetical protein
MHGDKVRSREVRTLVGYGVDSELAKEMVANAHTISSLKGLQLDELCAFGILEDAAKAITSKKRPAIPENNLNNVLFKARWTCCICRNEKKSVVIHHLVPWSQSKCHDEDNLVVLCLDHHGEAHTKRQLSLSLTADRLRAARELWYAEADQSARQEVHKIVQNIRQDQQKFAFHRGVVAWGDKSVAIYGNDGYGDDNYMDSPYTVRTRCQIALIRKFLMAAAINELAFGVSDDYATWVLLAESNDLGLLSAVVTDSFLRALGEQTNNSEMAERGIDYLPSAHQLANHEV